MNAMLSVEFDYQLVDISVDGAGFAALPGWQRTQLNQQQVSALIESQDLITGHNWDTLCMRICTCHEIVKTRRPSISESRLHGETVMLVVCNAKALELPSEELAGATRAQHVSSLSILTNCATAAARGLFFML